MYFIYKAAAERGESNRAKLQDDQNDKKKEQKRQKSKRQPKAENDGTTKKKG